MLAFFGHPKATMQFPGNKTPLPSLQRRLSSSLEGSVWLPPPLALHSDVEYYQDDDDEDHFVEGQQQFLVTPFSSSSRGGTTTMSEETLTNNTNASSAEVDNRVQSKSTVATAKATSESYFDVNRDVAADPKTFSRHLNSEKNNNEINNVNGKRLTSGMRQSTSLSLLPLAREASQTGFRDDAKREIWEFPTTTNRTFRRVK